MSARLPTASLLAAALLALTWGQHATAKPPDLPVQTQINCEVSTPPAEFTGTGPEAVSPQPTGGIYYPGVFIPRLADVQPSVQSGGPMYETVPPLYGEADTRAGADYCAGVRTFRRCLLFGIHPVLALLPAEAVFSEADEDAIAEMLNHAATSRRSRGFNMTDDPQGPNYESPLPLPWSVWGQFLSGHIAVSHWLQGRVGQMPVDHRPVGVINDIEPEPSLNGLTPVGAFTPDDAIPVVTSPELVPMPMQDGGVVPAVETVPPAHVGQIILLGNDNVRQNVILRQIPVSPGGDFQFLNSVEYQVPVKANDQIYLVAFVDSGAVERRVEIKDYRVSAGFGMRVLVPALGSVPIALDFGFPIVPAVPLPSPFLDILLGVQETRTGSLLFGVGVNSDAGLTGSVILNERNFDLRRLPASLEDLFSGRAFRGAGQEYRIEMVPNTAEYRLESVPGTQVQRYSVIFRNTGECSGPTCGPRPKAQAEDTLQIPLGEDVLGNLCKLEQAQKALHVAEFYRRTGHPGAACFYYETVHRLCPGSRYDEKAQAELSRLRAQVMAGRSAERSDNAPCEEQEAPPPSPPAAADCTCPYLKEQAQKKVAQHHAAEQQPAPSDALGNLEKLACAERVYRIAEARRRHGRLEDARACYESLRALCPGSRYDRMATERLRHLEDQAGTEEQEPQPAPKQKRYAPGKPGEDSRLERRLATPVSMSFADTPLKEVLEDLRNWQSINIVVDKPALEAEGITLDHPVSIKVENVSIKTALECILHEAHLAYKVEDGVVVVTTETGARGKQVTAAYAVGDLIAADAVSRFVQGKTSKAPAGGKSQAPEDRLIGIITSSVSPQSWNQMGGPGTIDYFPLGQTLVVSQTPDIQEQVAESLAALRRLNEKKEEKKSDKQSSARQTEEQVAQLLEACQKAVTEGRCADAQKLAERARALDADAVAAHPLVYKEHLLEQVAAGVAKEPAHTPSVLDAEKQIAELMQRYGACYREGLYEEAEHVALQVLALAPENAAAQAAFHIAAVQRCLRGVPSTAEPSCPAATTPCPMRRPDLPPIDPHVSGALDKVLIECGEQPKAKGLDITVEEAGTEEQEPRSTEGTQEECVPPAKAQQPEPGHEAMCPVMDALRSLACVDVEGMPLCCRGSCRVPLGFGTLHVRWDCREGQHSVEASLLLNEATETGAHAE